MGDAACIILRGAFRDLFEMNGFITMPTNPWTDHSLDEVFFML